MSEFVIGMVVGSCAGVAAMITAMWIANVEMVYKGDK
jgi:hypothetical protein